MFARPGQRDRQRDRFDSQCTVSSEASRFDIAGKMASAGGESSENNQDIPPNEEETTVYQNTEGIVVLFIVRRHQRETQRTKEHWFFLCVF